MFVNVLLMVMPVVLANEPGHICLAIILIIFVDGTIVSRVKTYPEISSVEEEFMRREDLKRCILQMVWTSPYRFVPGNKARIILSFAILVVPVGGIVSLVDGGDKAETGLVVAAILSSFVIAFGHRLLLGRPSRAKSPSFTLSQLYRPAYKNSQKDLRLHPLDNLRMADLFLARQSGFADLRPSFAVTDMGIHVPPASRRGSQ
ncbi:hypothetical protein BDK51DRAFT_36457 [Blyttiomyces helicus]|uniref:Uncharacterized protein n=1 Tax=Blyttiomyces helicus TaxID=388810 RepID=A0A4P9WA47_9FUNG|nr:hypothetical protein BDK51DRAFT_36457 [Blyttiomyces helicus]|eukprot:RKO89451.1 hypothetical protein BDK51DRAFT_36457 [Blyttiomyces helicus]